MELHNTVHNTSALIDQRNEKIIAMFNQNGELINAESVFLLPCTHIFINILDNNFKKISHINLSFNILFKIEYKTLS